MATYNQILDTQLEAVTTEPLTLQEAKDFCKIDIDTDDDIVEALIIAARQMCEAYTNISFVQRECVAEIDNTNGNTYLPYGPVGDVSEVLYADGNELTGTEYEIKGTEFKRIAYPKTLVTVTYEAGYTDLPEILKTALKNAVYYLYDNRAQATDGIGDIATKLLKPFRRV